MLRFYRNSIRNSIATKAGSTTRLHAQDVFSTPWQRNGRTDAGAAYCCYEGGYEGEERRTGSTGLREPERGHQWMKAFKEVCGYPDVGFEKGANNGLKGYVMGMHEWVSTEIFLDPGYSIVGFCEAILECM